VSSSLSAFAMRRARGGLLDAITVRGAIRVASPENVRLCMFDPPIHLNISEFCRSAQNAIRYEQGPDRRVT